MELKEAILTRRSIRKFQERDISPAQVEELLKLASWAPSANNYQMWFFYAIHSKEVKERIARAIEVKLDEILSWPEVKEIKEKFSWMSKYAQYVREAPWLIVFALEEKRSSLEELLLKRGLEREKMEHWRPHAGLQSVAAAIQNFLLAAHAEGLGAVWMVGPLFAVEEIEAILNVPPQRKIVALVPLGYPGESPSPKPRKVQEETWKIIL
jgi:nitroreductase